MEMLKMMILKYLINSEDLELLEELTLGKVTKQ